MTVAQLSLRPADKARYGRDHLRGEMLFGGGLTGLFLLALLIWAATARLDAAVPATGTVRLTGQRHVIQSFEMGSVAALRVREGQHVKKGQILVQFSSAAALAQERALASRAIGLQAQIGRLEALQVSSSSLKAPDIVPLLSAEDRAESERALAAAHAQLLSDLEVERIARATLGARLQQIDKQVAGTARRDRSSRTQLELNRQELSQVSGLAAQGYATRSRVLALERSGAALQGDVGATQAEIARLRSAAGEAQLDYAQARQQRTENTAEELRQARVDLQAALAQWQTARDVLSRTQVVAPVDGTVLALAVPGPGAVTPPDQKLMEIVPDRRGLEIDAQIPAGSANDVKAGQQVQVHLIGAHGRATPTIKGVVRRISPDSLTDERSGKTFYTASVTVGEDDLRKALGSENPDAKVRPGTPVSLQISLYPRTALQYWFEPLTQSLRGALHER